MQTMGHFWLCLLWRKKSYPPGNGAAGEDVNEKSKVCSVREKREDKKHFLYPIARSGFLEQNHGSYLMEEKEKKKQIEWWMKKIHINVQIQQQWCCLSTTHILLPKLPP